MNFYSISEKNTNVNVTDKEKTEKWERSVEKTDEKGRQAHAKRVNLLSFLQN